MARQIPHAEAGFMCPLLQKDMADVCHKCGWWTQLRGRHPQSNEEIDEWKCAIAMMPILQIENAQQTRLVGTAVEDLRNKMVLLNRLNGGAPLPDEAADLVLVGSNKS